MNFCMKLLKAEWKVNQQDGEEESKCCTIWLIVALKRAGEDREVWRHREDVKNLLQKTTDDDDKDNRGGANNWNYKTCKAPVKSSPPANQHPAFYRPDALPVPNQHWQHCVSIFMNSFIMPQKICETNSVKRDKPAARQVCHALH